MTSREKAVIAGFREWAHALKTEDKDTMRRLEREWYVLDHKQRWRDKKERNQWILDARAGGMRPVEIAYEMGLPRHIVDNVIYKKGSKEGV